MKKAHKAKKRLQESQRRKASHQTLPFIEHVYELRRRLFYIAVSVGVFSFLAYLVQHQIVQALLRPAKDQEFIYTSPAGGIDFLFRVCLYVGIGLSIPVIAYQFLRYIEPLIKQASVRFIAWGSAASAVLAMAGISFGYFIGLPSALRFLLHLFKTDQIQPLLSIQSYMSFVMIYLLGCALLFQVPLILIFINRIKPLKPRKLLSYERWVILFAVVAGGVINPSPSIIDQVMLAGPIILMYQLSIFLIWMINRKHRRPKKVVQLLQKDAETREQRLERFRTAQANLPAHALAAQPVAAVVIAPQSQPETQAVAAPAQSPVAKPAPQRPQQPRRSFNDFRPRPNYQLPHTQNLADA